MSSYNQHLRGSEWHKWDLHVHTPASSLAHSFGDDWNTYIEKLIDANQTHHISAIATADYFTIDGYLKLLSYYDSSTRSLTVNGKTTKLYLIPGIELRLNIFNNDNESVNVHILFDPEHCSPNFIESNFLEELEISYRSNKFPLKPQSLFAIGKSISDGSEINITQDFSCLNESTRSDYRKKALRGITLSTSDIKDALEAINKIFKKQKVSPKSYLLAVVGKGHGGISSLKWFADNRQFSRAGLIREDITHQADLIFSNDLSDRKFYLGERGDTPPEEVQIRFDNLKPCVWGSDSHTLEHLLHPSNGNASDYTWIKGEITFEGLRQITFEPKLRVRVQQDCPSEEEAYARIEKCTVSLPTDLKIKNKDSVEEIDFCLRGDHEIILSSNLSCIIGGRGSGKSTVIHILYNALHGEVERLSQLNSPLSSLKLSKDPLSRVREATKVEIPKNTEFFLQNEIEKFAKDIEEMSSLVKNRLYRLSTLEESGKSLQTIESEYSLNALSFDELIDAYEKITSINQKINLLSCQISTLKKQTEVIKSEDYKKLQKEIEEIASRVSAFETYDKEYKKVIVDITLLIKSIKRLDWQKFESQEVLNSFIKGLESHQSEITTFFEKNKINYEAEDNINKLNIKKVELKKYLSEKGLSPENIGELANATQEIADLESQIHSLSREKLPHEEIYSQKEDKVKSYRESYIAYKDEFFKVSRKLQGSLAGLHFDDKQTEITFHPRTNDQLLKDAIVAFIKDNNRSKTTLSSDSIQAVLFNHEISISELVDNKDKIINVVNSSERATIHTQVIQDLLNDPLFLEKMYLRMLKHHFDIKNIQVQTKIGDKLLQNTSFGERCGIVIAIVLVAGTNPIVIDQPEDNLDGKFISNVLVPLIRKQKVNRQIILVTRDANIVIGGDSELILILETEDCGTLMHPSSIENKSARPKYIWILDGGEKAFQKREEKYSIR